MTLREDQKPGYVKICYTLEDKNKAIGNADMKWRWATEEERMLKARKCGWSAISEYIEMLKNKLKG